MTGQVRSMSWTGPILNHRQPRVDAPRPEGRLWWMYVLVIVALIGIGSGAGQVTLLLSQLGNLRDVQTCLFNQGIRVGDISAQDAQRRGFSECTAANKRIEGAGMLGGAAATPVAAWLLMLGAGLTMRRRLRGTGALRTDGPAVQIITERFEHWCERTRLTDGRPPGLAVAGVRPVSGQAFTSALPFARPVVVIPAEYAYLEQGDLDLVLLHELAHVQARDLTWAGATWWAGLLNVPVLLIALLPAMANPDLPVGRYLVTTYYSVSLALAVALSLVTVVLRAAVLRRRERLADGYAVAMLGTTSPLVRAVRAADPGQPVASGPRLAQIVSIVGGWVSTHPRAATRALEATRPDRRWEAGFTTAAVTGLLAMFTYQGLYAMLSNLFSGSSRDPRLSSDLSIMVAAMIWAAVLVPIWSRNAPTLGVPGSWPMAHRVGWPTALGSALGLTSGLFMRAPTSVITPLRGYFEDLPLGILSVCAFFVAALGVTLLASGLAGACAAAGGNRRAETVRIGVVIAGVAVMAATTFAVHRSVSMQAVLLHSAAGARQTLLWQSVSWWPAWAPVVFVAALLLLARMARVADEPRRRTRDRALAVAFTAAVAGTTAAFLVVQSRLPLPDADARYLLASQRSWICALAGWVTTIVVLLLLRTRFLRALLAGAGVATLAGLLQYARDLAVGPLTPNGRDLYHLLTAAQRPLWGFCVLLILTLPVIVLLSDLSKLLPQRVQIRSRPVAVAVVSAITVVMVALTSAAVLTGVSGFLTTKPGDSLQVKATQAQWVNPQLATSAVEGAQVSGNTPPGRTLTPAEAMKVLTRVRQAFPPGWTPEPSTHEPQEEDTGIRPTSCRQAFDQVSKNQKARTPAADKTQTLATSADFLPPVGADIEISVVSFPDPAQAAGALDDLRELQDACRAWSLAGDLGGNRLEARWAPDDPLDLPYPSRTATVIITGRTPKGMLLQVTRTGGEIVVGHNTMSATIDYAYAGGPPPAKVIRQLRALRESVLRAGLAALSN